MLYLFIFNFPSAFVMLCNHMRNKQSLAFDYLQAEEGRKIIISLKIDEVLFILAKQFESKQYFLFWCFLMNLQTVNLLFVMKNLK